MKVALIGSVSSSHAALDALIRGGVEITAVLGLDESHAERASDYRSLRPLAEKAGLPFLAFTKVNQPHVAAFLRQHPPDLLWCIGLSQLIPDELLKLAVHGGIGFHPTMLPRGRGRAPVAWTILLGERAAVNLFYLAEEPDAGDIIVQREVPVLPDDYSEDLIARTNDVLHEVVLELAPAIKEGALPRSPQDHAQATYYAKRTPADGLIDWSKTTDEIYRLIRAAGRPYPGAFGVLGDTRITIWRAVPQASRFAGAGLSVVAPGSIIHMDPDGRPLVLTGDGAIRVLESESDHGGDSAQAPFEIGGRFRGPRGVEDGSL